MKAANQTCDTRNTRCVRARKERMKIRISIAVFAIVVMTGWKTGAQIYDTNGEYVQTFVGSGEQGYVDGQGLLTKFSNPSQVVADTSGNLYVWDSGNHLIRKITPGGTVSTFAGGGADYEGYGTNVSFSYYSFGPMAMDHSNTIWVNAGTFLLNIGTNSYVTIENGGSGLTSLSTASGICFDSANNLYYTGGNIIFRYSPNTGISQPFAGNGTSGYVDGNGTVFPEFAFGSSGASSPGLACDEANNIYVWDYGNNRIRRIDQSQNITTIAGRFYNTSIDGVGTNASFAFVGQMFADNAGNVYFVSTEYIRKMNAQTNVVTMAGSFGASGFTNGPGSNALFSAQGACFSQGTIFVADYGNQVIRNIVFNPQVQVVSPANLQLSMYPGLQITGLVGRTYQIQTSPNLSNWATRATLLLTSSPYLWIDQNPVSGSKFYRALLLP
jgi:hypothetical protein